MELSGASFIGGERVRGGGALFNGVNPATGERLEPGYGSVGQLEVERAARAADVAWWEYRGWSGKRRGELLRAIAARIEARGEAVIARAHLETALPVARLTGELGRTCGQLRMFAALVEEGSWVDARIDHADPARKPAPKPDVRSMLRPLGPVAVFGASNFPLAFSVAGGDTASALAAGCPVIVKAHPAHPGTSELVAGAVVEAVREVGAPAGVFSMVFDAGHEIGIALVKHLSVAGVGFTGSRRAGLALMAAAASRDEPIPVYAEMGSVNPVVVLAGAQRERGREIAAGLHASVTLGVGQFCTNPGLVFVEECEATEGFVAELDRLFAASPAGVMLTAGIRDAYVEGLARLEGCKGVKRRASGAIASGDASAAAVLFEIEGLAFFKTGAGEEETFGPTTVLVRGDAPNGTLLQMLHGQLTVTIHAGAGDGEGVEQLMRIAEERAGRVVMNGFPTGVEVCHAMVHGGPFPATGDGRSTSVGSRAIERFTRAVCYQGFADSLLPEELKEANPLGIWRIVNGKRETGKS